jgi:PAS domain S-box-containing protein
MGEREEAEAALQYQSQLTRTIADNAASGLFMVDGQGRVTYMNPSAERMTGYTVDETVGRVLHDLLHHTHADGTPFPRSECPLDRAVRRHTELRDYEDALVRKDGSFVPVRCAASPIAREEAPIETVIEVVDITQERRIEEERRTLDRLKEEFIAAASHDLKTPLAAIKGYAQLLVRRLRDPSTEPALLSHGLAVIDSQADALASMVDDLLDASRIQAGAFELRTARCDLRVCLANVLNSLTENERASVDAALPAAALVGRWEQKRIEQVLANLIGNALKYSPRAERIDVVVTRRAAEVEVAVVDRGMGLPPEELEPIFDRYYRSPQARDSSLAGTGLGLYICRGIVAAHGGRLWAESPGEGQGATFRFTLPAPRATGRRGSVRLGSHPRRARGAE